MKCGNCGAFLNDSTNFCTNCGAPTNISSGSVSNNKKNGNKKVIIVVSIIVIIGLIFSIFMLIKGGLFNRKQEENTQSDILIDDKDNLDYEKKTFNLFDTNMPKELGNDKDISKNIEIYDIFFNPNLDYGRVYIYGKNNNDTWVKVSIDIEYYDAEGYRIEKQGSLSTIVKANSEFVLDATVPDDSINYVRTKLLYSASKVESYYTDINLNDLTIRDVLLNEDNIEVLITNNSSIKINIAYIGCVYYKDGKEVFAVMSTASDINPNASDKASCYSHFLRLGSNYDSPTMEFDDYKTVVFSAYYYDSENY